MANNKRVIAVDLDGTLAHYDGWKGIEHIGPVVPEVANAMERAQKEGADVWIFTARVSDPVDAEEAGKYIEEWLKANNFQYEGITAVKHKFFTEFWDDRAIQVIKNEGMFVLNELTDQVCLNDGNDFGQDTKPEPAFTPAEEEPRTPTSALDIQEGGNHYKKYKIQPIEFVFVNNIPVLEANAQKYILRHADKNGMEDLRKARHYLELMAEMYYGEKL